MSRTVALDLTLNGTVVCNDQTTLSALHIKRTAISASTYTILLTDYLIGCDTTSNAIALTLPYATTNANQVYVIVDEGGNLNTNNIVIDTNGGNINGSATITLNVNYTSIAIYSNGTNYHIF